jgi:hypothetical protein
MSAKQLKAIIVPVRPLSGRLAKPGRNKQILGQPGLSQKQTLRIGVFGR